ncbi:hypothetical protein F5884DRAFT_764177 [Xylogone sp. PMI_703]|nr:hypothetical protein F5884DRAFT_764177 [Xylogone sp. PMI_703]
MRVQAIASLLGLLTAASALRLRASVPSSPRLANPSTLPSTTTATLTSLSHQQSAILRADNTFDFRNVSSGSYLLDVHCPSHWFAPLRVDIHAESPAKSATGDEKAPVVQVWGTFRGNEWDNKGEEVPVNEVAEAKDGNEPIYGFEVKAGPEKEYYVERAGFSPLAMLKSPMILLALFSMGIVFGMPYLIENMDEETKAEFEQRQKSSPLSGNPAANPLQNFDAAAWLAGSSSKRTEAAPAIEKGVTR